MIKVLIVDDEKDFTELLSERLETRGFKTRIAFDGNEAISRLKEENADVVLLDVMMPGKSGVETLKEIKNSWPITEVIMLTGHGTVETAIEGMKLGAYDYLIKPTETEDLSQKITSAYQRKSDHEERIRQAEINKIIEHKGW
ncbi:MAG: two-component system, OmpR family, response regulator CpxR [Thermodesulfobacteriota bacterium]|jgi:DNA-binding response OmpR family regulator|nr:two-component system, OmpR family, response regulator CpxR [Thermodesulfobacteriota bacterium]